MRGCGWGGRCCACGCSCVGAAEGAQYRAHILERLWCDVKRDGLMLFVHPLPRLPTAISSTNTRLLSTASPGTMWPDETLSIAHVKGHGFAAQPVPSAVAPLRRIGRVPMVCLARVATRCTVLQHAVLLHAVLCCKLQHSALCLQHGARYIRRLVAHELTSALPAVLRPCLCFTACCLLSV